MNFLKKIKENKCNHSWRALSKTNIYCEFGWEKTILFLACDKCGKIKKVKIK